MNKSAVYKIRTQILAELNILADDEKLVEARNYLRPGVASEGFRRGWREGLHTVYSILARKNYEEEYENEFVILGRRKKK